MYNVRLSESLFPAQTDDVVREITVGGLLREIATQRPTAEALVEVDQDGQPGQRWTYTALLADSERLALALATRFRPAERVEAFPLAGSGKIQKFMLRDRYLAGEYQPL